jgi:hypothetical protein
MAKPKRKMASDTKIVATVKSVKGNCSWGHEEGDSFEISCHDTAGGYPPSWGNPDVINVECMDKYNLVKMELRRVKVEK